MPESNLPDEGTADSAPMSFDAGVDKLTNLISDSEPPNLDEKVEAEEAEEDAAEPVEGEEAETDADAEDKEDDAEGEDGSEEVKGGRFAPDTAKVTLSDGTVITVADLKRNNLFQADYTRKTTELRTEREAVTQEKSQVGQMAQAIAQQRDFILQAAQVFLPKAPDKELMQSDPFGYMQAKVEYDERMQVINQLLYQKQAEGGRMTEEQQEAKNQHRAAEAERLFEAIPEFRDRKVYDQFWNEAVEIMAEFGYTPDELQEADDHRQYRVMRELVKYRKAQKLVPKVKQELAAKPKMMAGGKRMDPKAKTSRETEARREILRKTGSFDAGVELLKGFNL